MKQELLDTIKSHYEDYTKMVETNFEELKKDFVTPGRKKVLEHIEKEYLNWVEKEENIDECILVEAIKTVIRDENNKEIDLGETNEILMYISELEYETYALILKLDMTDKNPKEVFILYMDIENKKMYFVKKENQEEFEKEHKIIVRYKNPNCNAGWNFDRNYEDLPYARREFIKDAIYNGQEEATIQFVKKYQG